VRFRNAGLVRALIVHALKDGLAREGKRSAAGGDGAVPDIELVWASVYTFACLRMEAFRHGRVLFAGDSAHGVSPFGARGANSGIQDADNLAWKLAAVVQGRAPLALLDGYARERELASDENLLHSTRSTDFITPKSEISRVFRDATLTLAKDFDFARRLVNSGRLSMPTTQYGQPAPDAPIRIDGHDDWLLRQMRPGRFTALVFDTPPPTKGGQRVSLGPEWGLGVQEGSPMPRGEPALGLPTCGLRSAHVTRSTPSTGALNPHPPSRTPRCRSRPHRRQGRPFQHQRDRLAPGAVSAAG
jgi:3-(3-hydroxy-phenyl)propionate hydroxylase